jgi:hypothetical protein
MPATTAVVKGAAGKGREPVPDGEGPRWLPVLALAELDDWDEHVQGVDRGL